MSPTAQKAQPELWRHIVERPHDFDARRVLCDALLAEGNPLGEFMRQALLPKPQRDHARAKQLLEKHRDEWFPRPPFVSYKAQWAHVDSLLASGGIPDGHWLFPDLAALDWWEAHYPLRELFDGELDEKSLAVFSELARRGHLSRLERLKFRMRSEVAGVEELFARVEPGLQKLDLTLIFNTPAPDLPAARWLEQVKELRVVTASAHTLTKLWPSLHSLEVVELAPHWREPHGVPETTLPSLERKRLRAVKVDSGPKLSALQVVEAADPSTLSRLELINNRVAPLLGPFVESARETGFPELTHLQLFGQSLFEVPELLRLPLPKLRELDLRSNSIDVEEQRELTNLPFFARLERVGLSHNPFSYDPMPHPPSLDTVREKLAIPTSIEVF